MFSVIESKFNVLILHAKRKHGGWNPTPKCNMADKKGMSRSMHVCKLSHGKQEHDVNKVIGGLIINFMAI